MAEGADRRDSLQQFGVVAPGDEGEAVDPARSGQRRQLDDLLDERGREVVDDVPAEILHHVGDTGTPGTGQSGDHDDVSHLRQGYFGRSVDDLNYALARDRSTTDCDIDWLGHATALIDLGGIRFLTDPALTARLAHLRRHHAVDLDGHR